MCLAIPAQLVSEPNDIGMAEVDILGVKRHISVMMTPGVTSGDFVLVHAGFAIQVVDEQFAAESLEMLSMMGVKTAEEIEAEMGMAGDEAEGAGADGAEADTGTAPATASAPASELTAS